MANKILELFTYISSNHPENFNDYFYAMSLLENCIKDSKELIKQDYHSVINEENGTEIAHTSQLFKYIKDAENILSTLFDIISSLSKQNSLKQTSTFDDNYSIQTLPNFKLESQFNWFWQTLNDNFESTKVNRLMFNNQEYEVKDLGKALLKICELLYDLDDEKFKTMVDSDVAYGSTIRYLSFIGGDNRYIKMCNAHIFLWTNTSSNLKIELIKKMLNYYDISHNTVKLSIRNNYSPKPRNTNTANKSSEIKIGKYVKERMRILSDNQYCFSEANLTALTDKDLSHQLVGCTLPFLVSYSDMEQGKAERAKYWKDIFIFNGERYYITSLWAERMRESFNKWYKGLKA